MSRKSADLLQALLERQKAAQAKATAPAEPVAEPAPKPESPARPIGFRPAAAVAAPVRPEPPPPPPGPARPDPVLPRAPRSEREISLSFPTLMGGTVAAMLLLIGSFFLGRWSAGAGGGGEALSTKAPSVAPFNWNKPFTVQAAVLGLGREDLDTLARLEKYLEQSGVLASRVEVSEGGTGKKRGALFVGGADRANDGSLVKLRDWLRDLPGPDGSGRPFQSAEIRETPRLAK